MGACVVRETRTAHAYRPWSIGDRHPAMVRVTSGGVAVEVWEVPPAGLADILMRESPGLSIGKVTLEDGTEALGLLGEPAMGRGQREITTHGGWRACIAAREEKRP